MLPLHERLPARVCDPPRACHHPPTPPQDIAWRGSLFDAFATFASWPQDYLCAHPSTRPAGAEAEWRGVVPSLFHSGWINATAGAAARGGGGGTGNGSAPAPPPPAPATLQHCYVFMTRYSAALLHNLSAHHAAGNWAHSEHEAAELCARDASCSVGDMGAQSRCSDLLGSPFNAFDNMCTGWGGRVAWSHRPPG